MSPPAAAPARDERGFLVLLVLGILAAAALARATMISFQSPWANEALEPLLQLAVRRPISALADRSLGALPPATLLFEALAMPWREALPKMPLVKLPALLCEPLLALAVYLLVRRAASRARAAIAVAAALLAPTVLQNGALVGWADAGWTAALLLALWAAAAGRAAAAAGAWGVAVALAPASWALAPALFVAWRRQRLSWPAAAIAAAVILAALALTWVVTPSWTELLGRLFPFQREPVPVPHSGVAPSLYMFLTPEQPTVTGPFGLAALVLVVVALVHVATRERGRMSAELLCLTAYVFVAIVAFGLPRAHARFGFPADLLAIVLAGMNPAWLPLAIGQQLVSLCAYAPAAMGPAELGPLGAALNLALLPWALLRWLALVDPEGLGARLPRPDGAMLARAFLAIAAAFIAWSFAMRLLMGAGVNPALLWPSRRTDFAGFVVYLLVAAAAVPAVAAAERFLRQRFAATPRALPS